MQLMTVRGAEIVKLNKGTLKVGADADVTIIDPPGTGPAITCRNQIPGASPAPGARRAGRSPESNCRNLAAPAASHRFDQAARPLGLVRRNLRSVWGRWG